jgi:hypothetical protein
MKVSGDALRRRRNLYPRVAKLFAENRQGRKKSNHRRLVLSIAAGFCSGVQGTVC